MLSQKVEEYISGLLHSNVYLFLVVSILHYIFGGIDEYLIILLILNVINILLAFLTKGDVKAEVIHKLKISIVIIIAVMADRLLGMDSNSTLRFRDYCIAIYSYGEMVVICKLLEDERFKIPRKLKALLSKKGDDKKNGN